MNPEKWNKINDLFAAWLDLNANEQTRFLEDACRDDPDLRKELDLLIEAHRREENILETPVFHHVARAMADDESLQAGRQIGAYKILKEIGRGGMGAVYLAARADEQFQKRVAIKLIKRGMDTDQVLQRFRNERQILAGFDHPNVARLLDGGSTEDGLPYFVMEYVEGSTIHQFCDEKRLNITERLRLFRQVCAAVDYAHRNLVVHRDIKPSNILVTGEGVPKLLDFGIAKILQPQSDDAATATGMVLMTPEYASPEQAQGSNVTTASDVYSLGVVLYELLTGHPPYDVNGIPALEVARIISESRPQLPSTVVDTSGNDDSGAALTPESVSRSREGTPDRLRRRLKGELDNIVLMALRKEPHRRYQSVEQFSEDIRRHLEGLPVMAHPDSFGYRATKFITRNKAAVAASTFALLALLVATGIAGLYRWRANQQARVFQEFGQEAASIEGTLRVAALLPLHDITPQKQIVRQRLQHISQKMDRMNSDVLGPAHYTLGRGYLALESYREANRHLDLAWERYHYREPAVAFSLGYTLALLYGERLSMVQRVTSREQREAQMKEIDLEYRRPALELIRQGRSAAESPEYVEALLAFLEQRYDDALQKASQAFGKMPWLYESVRLEGDIYTTRGTQRAKSGDHASAMQDYYRAEKAYGEAIAIGRSDPEGYQGLCALQEQRFKSLLVHTGEDLEPLYIAGQKNCQDAVRADPSAAKPYLILCLLHLDRSFLARVHGGDMPPYVQKAIEAGEEALQRDAESAEILQALGNAYGSRADFEISKNQDPMKSLNTAEKYYREALRINANLTFVYVNLGKVYHLKGARSAELGEASAQFFDQAIAALQRVLQKYPNHFYSYSQMGLIYWSKANDEMAHGRDPLPENALCRKSYEQVIRINPAYMGGYLGLGAAYQQMAEYEIEYGKNPTENLLKAIEQFRKSIQIDAHDNFNLGSLVQTYRSMAEYKVLMKQDPTKEIDAMSRIYENVGEAGKAFFPEVAAGYALKAQFEWSRGHDAQNWIHMAHDALAKAEGRLDESFESADIVGARLALVQARVDRRGAKAHLALARKVIRQILLQAPRSQPALLLSGELACEELRFGNPQSAMATIREGLEALEKLLMMNPRNARALAAQGKLLQLSGNTAEGAAKLEAALNINKNLKLSVER